MSAKAIETLVKATYSLTEVAALLGRPRQTVSDWARRGILTTVLIGTRPFVPLAALQAHGMVWESIKLASDIRARAAK